MVVHALGIPPWWLQARSSFADQLSDAFHPAAILSDATCVMLLLGLAALVILGVRRRQPSIVAGAALALVLSAALAAAASSTPTRNLLALTLGYTLWWGAPAGMFAWLVLAWGYGSLLAERIGRPVNRPAARTPAVMLTLLAAGLAAAVAAVAEGPDLNQAEYRPTRSLTSQVLARLQQRTTLGVMRVSSTDAAYNYEAALLYALRRDGRRVVSADLAVLLSNWYAPSPTHPPLTLGVVQGPTRSRAASGSVASAAAGGVRVVLIRRD